MKIILSLGNRLNLPLILSLGALAGIFHGYAYDEAIFGAEMSPLVAYLAGFATGQMVIARLFFAIGRSASKQTPSLPSLDLRFAGFTLTGVGLAFLSSAMVV
ncbi:MAG: HupE/UreJ family protein [Cyanobacteria bacterium J06635_1]